MTEELAAMKAERDAAYRQAVRLFAALAPQCIPQAKLTHVIDQIDNWTMGAKARLADMTAERDELVRCTAIDEQQRLALLDDNATLAAQLAANEAARVRMREALVKYGRHDQGCPVIVTPELCSCGLTEALAEPNAEDAKSC